MASRRLTNNSVATLDEQSDVLQSILSKESKIAKEKKLRKKKEKLSSNVEKRAKPAALGSSMSEHNMADFDDQSVRSDELPTWSEAKAMQAGAHVDQQGELDQIDFYEEEESIMDDESEAERAIHDMSYDDRDSVSQADVELVQEPVLAPKPLEIKKKGIYADILKQNIEHVKEADKVAPKMSEEIAFGLNKYMEECVYTSDMEKLSKQYHRVENVKAMKVPRLDTEVYQVVHQDVRNNDQGLQTVQKAIVSSIAALAPLLELGFDRADGDKELDECSRGLWDSLQLMSFALNGISTRRRELIKPSLAPIYARVLTKGHETTPEWLYGGNLIETTRKCEASKKLSDKILKPKPQPQNKATNAGRGGKQVSRGRGQLRGFIPYQNRRQQQAQQQFPQQSQQFYQGAGQSDYQRYQKQQFQAPYVPHQQQNPQGFPKNKANFPK